MTALPEAGAPGPGVPDPGFGLYVHWPFCRAKCPYCDFNSHVRDGVDHDRWRRALLAELDHVGAETAGRRLTSVFFGGGTPSLMAPATAGALIERAGVGGRRPPTWRSRWRRTRPRSRPGSCAAFATPG
jgi:coproporphyrinogen III oxidase-like Fe-S oxidoreductase